MAHLADIALLGGLVDGMAEGAGGRWLANIQRRNLGSINVKVQVIVKLDVEGCCWVGWGGCTASWASREV